MGNHNRACHPERSEGSVFLLAFADRSLTLRLCFPRLRSGQAGQAVAGRIRTACWRARF